VGKVDWGGGGGGGKTAHGPDHKKKENGKGQENSPVQELSHDEKKGKTEM